MKNTASRGVVLHIGDNDKLSINITFADLVLLYEQFIEKYHRVPTSRDCLAKNNMPQTRIINRVLNDNGITYKEFLSRFGKTSHVRVDSYDFGLYLQRYKTVCDRIGRALTGGELRSNSYGLPSASWFVNRCPDANVNTYNDFVLWCGYQSNNLKREKSDVVNALVEYEKKIGRPLTMDDIKKDKIGFSMIVINRLFGSLSNARKECGLMPSLNGACTFDVYRDSLADLLIDFKNKTGRDTISWREIDSRVYGANPFHRKTYLKHFEANHVDIFQFMSSYGVQMNPSEFSTCMTLSDGERLRSSMEYDMSIYLRSLGLHYNIDYRRDVRYSEYFDLDSRIDCDYVVDASFPIFIEVAGIIYNPESTNSNNERMTHTYSSTIENEYRDKMVIKKELLDKNQAKYCFVFLNDMQNGNYRNMISDLLLEVKE